MNRVPECPGSSLVVSPDQQCASYARSLFETGPEGPELEDYQAEKKSKATQTRPKKLIRRVRPLGAGSRRLTGRDERPWK